MYTTRVNPGAPFKCLSPFLLGRARAGGEPAAAITTGATSHPGHTRTRSPPNPRIQHSSAFSPPPRMVRLSNHIPARFACNASNACTDCIAGSDAIANTRHPRPQFALRSHPAQHPPPSLPPRSLFSPLATLRSPFFPSSPNNSAGNWTHFGKNWAHSAEKLTHRAKTGHIGLTEWTHPVIPPSPIPNQRPPPKTEHLPRQSEHIRPETEHIRRKTEHTALETEHIRPTA